MGFEYRAAGESHLLSACFNKICDLLKTSDRFQVLGDQNKKIVFRWTSHPIDEKWHEDGVLHFEADHLYLLIHGAPRQAIEALLDEINSFESGVTFKEI